MSEQDDYNERNKGDASDGSCIPCPTGAPVSNFPAKLHFMLNDLKRDGKEYIASWQPHGRCFIVRKPKEFENEILPCYFQQSKFTSFQRQLSFYGFRRIVSGQDKGGYFHEYFLRGKEELAVHIQRTKIKGTGPRKPNSMELPTPNFYEMPFLTKNDSSNNDDEQNRESSQNQKYDSAPPETSAKVSEVILSGSTTSPFCQGEDDKVVAWTASKERLRQIQLLNEIERNPLWLPHDSSTIQNYLQVRASSQTLLPNVDPAKRLHALRNWEVPAATPTSCGYSMSKHPTFAPGSLLGLNYPVTLSSVRPSSCKPAQLPLGMSFTTQASSTPNIIRTALANYFQQKSSSGDFLG